MTNQLRSTTRVEQDGLGTLELPEAALYGTQTARALAIYPDRLQKLSEVPLFLRTYAQVKHSAALTNLSLGELDQTVAQAIIVAASELAEGRWNDDCCSPLLQGAGGVTTNMNINEVIANRATQLLREAGDTERVVHPNDHVNRSQSTNDTYPTAALLTTKLMGAHTTLELSNVVDQLKRLAEDQKDQLRLGRTCLRDALPVPARQLHTSHEALVQRALDRLNEALAPLSETPLGATAVGTGAGAHPEFGSRAVIELSKLVGIEVQQSSDLADALANMDALSNVANALEGASSAMNRVAKDIRLLSSGPVGGFNELRFPKIAAGSSIMPGKTNPTIPEFVMQTHMLVQGKALTIRAAVDAGELELNVMEPVLYSTLWSALKDVEDAARLLHKSCLNGLEWNNEVLETSLQGSYLAGVQAARTTSYSEATQLARSADT